ncbi:MAG: hypothetical protein K2K12_06000 [Clostridia bacterium]|nr:hypothetical protein [Clostridia bacterium]
MDKNKISFTIIKTTLIVTIAFCLLTSLLGLVSLFSFRQMVETDIRLSGYGLMASSKVTEKFADVSLKTIIMAFLVFFLIILNVLHLTKFLIKSEKAVKSTNIAVSAICIAAQIAAIVLCIIIMKQSFDLIDALPKFNDNSKSYYDYVYLQSYQNAALSTFTPFIVASISSALISIASIISSKKKSNKNMIAQQQSTQIDASHHEDNN